MPLKKATEVKVIRDNQPMTLNVTVQEQPSEFGNAAAPAPRQPSAPTGSIGLANIGVQVSDLNDTMADELGFRKGTHGVVIVSVEPGSVAAEAGLRKGTLITKVDSQKVTTAAQAQQAIQAASLQRGMLLQVQSPQGGTNFVLLKGTGAAS